MKVAINIASSLIAACCRPRDSGLGAQWKIRRPRSNESLIALFSVLSEQLERLEGTVRVLRK